MHDIFTVSQKFDRNFCFLEITILANNKSNTT